MKKLKKIVLVFCVLLSSFLVFLIPYGAKTQGIDSRFGVNAFIINRYDQKELDKPIDSTQYRYKKATAINAPVAGESNNQLEDILDSHILLMQMVL